MITQQELKKLLHYDPESGIFTWKIRVGQRSRAGDIAGDINSRGYHRIGIKGKSYRSHRLAFLYVTGRLPEKIDHKDGNSSNNRWNNLREATTSQNGANRKPNINSTSGYKGVSYMKKNTINPWQAIIKVSGKNKWLGVFSTPEKAAMAYDMAAQKYFGEFASLNFNNNKE